MKNNPQNWIYYYQTLITGFLAVVAAIATIYFVRKQIKQADKHRKDDLKRRNWSDRAKATADLSQITTYWEDYFHFFFKALNQWRQIDEPSIISEENHRNEMKSIEKAKPDFPDEAYRQIAQLVATAKQTDAEVLSEFLTWSQMYRARIDGFISKRIGDPDNDVQGYLTLDLTFFSGMNDALDMYHFSVRFFDYVRDVRSGKISDWSRERNSNLLMKYGLAFDGENDWYKFLKTAQWPPSSYSEHK
ncbi:MAG: hypothetical protein COA91_01915 [Robiginitomaculum sp.]|nr:MAG: hypothetical protein COA91_01915 [Robiginitomaculum sp.]